MTVKHLYLIRHCQAHGQKVSASLTVAGFQQAERLVSFFEGKKIDRILSSPFRRAVQTADPLAAARGLEIERDDRLAERVMSGTDMADWKEKLKETFDDFTLAFEGGESNESGMKRVSSLLGDLQAADESHIVLVSHGNLSVLLLRSFEESYGYDHMMKMSNPDVFHIEINEHERKIRRIWC
ncbi:histidine phosphatase family protein [Peribacillus frigoritolerans]|uniref:histidine phosphatase family protein n=1 Tax=Peribacillus frigoritolerans TaxID=450367 RepID=UPI00105A0AA9|nr:histidine phosphatase family protein [Peribacillus frigoritolerans]TDL82449.1 histidine phosphatase family protein [Peribacillus frigoritolerans]